MVVLERGDSGVSLHPLFGEVLAPMGSIMLFSASCVIHRLAVRRSGISGSAPIVSVQLAFHDRDGTEHRAVLIAD